MRDSDGKNSGLFARARAVLRAFSPKRSSFGMGIRLIAFNPVRLLAAFAGIAVAVAVMFVELGLLTGLLNSQALMASVVRGELVVLSEARTDLHKWNDLSRIRLNQIAAAEGVERVIPMYQANMGLSDPDTNTVRRILVIAFPPEDLPIAIGNPEEIAQALRTPNTILFDRRSRPIYADLVLGGEAEINDLSYRVGGFVDLGPDVIHDGVIIMSDASYFARFPAARPIMGVIRLSQGANPDEVRANLAASLPDDVSVFTPDELHQREISFTLRSAPLGFLFGIGMFAGLVIGSITCYQILFNEIVDRLKQYATLKAMGFSNGFLRGLIVEQALLLACGGFAGGLFFAWICYAYIAGKTALAVQLSLGSVTLILVLATVMCIVAGLLALRRVSTADPAELY
jgi:putative ABC transport system permease protein